MKVTLNSVVEFSLVMVTIHSVEKFTPRFVEDVTGVSLYGDPETFEIPNETVNQMADDLEATVWRDSYIQNYDIEEQEFKDLVKMFRLHADAGHYLLAWY